MAMQWYYLDDLSCEPDGDKGWVAFAPADSAVIEEAFSAGKPTASLKHYTIHVKKLYQYRNDDKQKQRPVRRAPPGLGEPVKPATTKELKTVQEYQVAIRVLEDTHTKRVEELNGEHAEKVLIVEKALDAAKKKATADLEKQEAQHQIEKAKWKAEIVERERQVEVQKEQHEVELAKVRKEYQANEEQLKKKHNEMMEEAKRKSQEALSKLYEQARSEADLAKNRHQEALMGAHTQIERLKAELGLTRTQLNERLAQLKSFEAKQKAIVASLSEALHPEEDATLAVSQELEVMPTVTITVPPSSSSTTNATTTTPYEHQPDPPSPKLAIQVESFPASTTRLETGGGSPTQEYHEESEDDVDLRGGPVDDPQATQAYSPDSPKADMLKRKRQSDGEFSDEDLGDTDVDEAEGGQPSLATQKVSTMDSESPYLGQKRHQSR